MDYCATASSALQVAYDMDFQSGHITAMLSLVSLLVYSYLFFEKKPCKINKVNNNYVY